jgi:glyoxylase-like metal-dependent hydrolase (beta-lactamase superfamily II)
VPVAIRIVNLYLLRSRDGWVLFDCGTDSETTFTSLTSTLGSIGIAMRDLRMIIVTHCHADHVGMAQTLHQLSGAELVVHKPTVSWVQRLYGPYADRRGDVEHLARSHGLPSDEIDDLHEFNRRHSGWGHVGPYDRVVSDADQIEAGEFKFRVIATPGHAPDHMCLHAEQQGWLFAGDHLLRNITPHVGFNDPMLEDPLGDFEASLHRMSALATTLVLAGHGTPFRDAGERSTAVIKHHEHRAEKVRSIVRHQALSAFQVTRLLFGRRQLSHDQRHLAFTETLAHLEYLRRRGVVNASDRDGLVVYLAA